MLWNSHLCSGNSDCHRRTPLMVFTYSPVYSNMGHLFEFPLTCASCHSQSGECHTEGIAHRQTLEIFPSCLILRNKNGACWSQGHQRQQLKSASVSDCMPSLSLSVLLKVVLARLSLIWKRSFKDNQKLLTFSFEWNKKYNHTYSSYCPLRHMTLMELFNLVLHLIDVLLSFKAVQLVVCVCVCVTVSVWSINTAAWAPWLRRKHKFMFRLLSVSLMGLEQHQVLNRSTVISLTHGVVL